MCVTCMPSLPVESLLLSYRQNSHSKPPVISNWFFIPILFMDDLPSVIYLAYCMLLLLIKVLL